MSDSANIVVTEENVHQVVQALYENCKSNQHRLDHLEPILENMATRVERLDTLLVGNGYAKAVEDSSREIKEVVEKFDYFVANRKTTCPTAAQMERDNKHWRNTRTWTATVLRVVFASIGALSTLIIIIDKLIESI